jgi:transcriptional regulator with XRE-family HTH domain
VLSAECKARLGQNIARARKGTGMSQETVAVRAGLHRTEIGLLERAERIPKIDTLLKVAGAMSVSPDQLLRGIAWEACREEVEKSPQTRIPKRNDAPPATDSLSRQIAAICGRFSALWALVPRRSWRRYHAPMSEPKTRTVAPRDTIRRALRGLRRKRSKETSADAILRRAGARHMSPEEFDRHFGDLPTDGEG